MDKKTRLIILMIGLAISLIATSCNPPPCQLTTHIQIDVYRVPDSSTDVWGVEAPGITREILARTADGWVGYDPGVAQAGNIGLAHHRYFKLNAIVSPNCLASVPLVTIADVEADIAASGGP